MVKHLISVVLLLSVLSGCSGGIEESRETLQFVDDRGKEVILPKHVDRIVSLGPSFTEIVYALGGEGNLVGVTTYCDFPLDAKLKPKVGDFLNPSIERVIATRPDCILATGPAQSRTIERLEKLGYSVVQLNPESILGTKRCMMQIGRILGRIAVADSLVKEFESGVEHLKALTSEIQERKRLFLEIDSNPLVSAGPESFIGELIALAGGQNIVESGAKYPVINAEFITQKNPDVIIVANPAVSPDDVRSRIGWGEINAVKHERVYSIEPGLISRPGPRAVVGAMELFRLLYPSDSE